MDKMTGKKSRLFITALIVATSTSLFSCAIQKRQYTGSVIPLESIRELMQVTILESNELNPEISHDGNKILFQSDKAGNQDIFVADLTGMNAMHVTFDSSDDGNPSWTPDGKGMYFDSNRLGYRAIFKKDFNQERITTAVVTRGTNDFAPDISPSNTLLVFGNQSDNKESLWILALKENKIKHITEGSSPEWSPDGKRILFTSTKTGNSDVWLVDSNASVLTQLTLDSGDDVSPDWSPDGKTIVFSSNRTGNFDIWTLDIEQNRLTQLTNNPANDGHPVWTPDGKYIYFHSDRSGNMDIWRIEPVLSDLK